MKFLRFRHIGIAILVLKTSLIAYLIYTVSTKPHTEMLLLDTTLWQFILVGFLAQLVDGTLGMAYGVSCSTLLLNLGVSPKIATAAVHTAEVFTTGVSGLSHLKFGNIDKKLFLRIVITGVAGAMIGAYLISAVFDGKLIKPYIATY